MQATCKTFRSSKAANISLVHSLKRIKTSAVRCVDGAYAVLFILLTLYLMTVRLVNYKSNADLFSCMTDSGFKGHTEGFLC